MAPGTRKFKPWNPAAGQDRMSFNEFAVRHPGIQNQGMMRDKYSGSQTMDAGTKFNARHEGDVVGDIAQGRIRIIPEAVPGAAPSSDLMPVGPKHPMPEDINALIGNIPPDDPRMNQQADPAAMGGIANRLNALGQGANMLPSGLRAAMKRATGPNVGDMTQQQFSAQAGKNWSPEQKRKAYKRLSSKKEH